MLSSVCMYVDCRQVTAELLRKHGVEPSKQSAEEAAAAEEGSDSGSEDGSEDASEGNEDGSEESEDAGDAAVRPDEFLSGEEEDSGEEGGSGDSEYEDAHDGSLDRTDGEAARSPAGSKVIAGSQAAAAVVPLPAPEPSRPVR